MDRYKENKKAGGTRKQFMMIYVQVLDTVNQEKNLPSPAR